MPAGHTQSQMAIAEADPRVTDEATSHDLLHSFGTSASPVRSVAKGALALLCTQPLTWAASLISIIIAPRYLGDVALGQITLGLTLTALVGPVVGLGLLEYLSRSLASRSKDAPREAALAWVLMTITASLAALVVGVAVALSGLQLGSPVVLFAALGAIVLTPSQGLLLTILRGQERMGRFAAINSISAAAGALVPVLVLVAGGGLNGCALAGLIVAVVSVAISWRTSGIHLPRVQLSLSQMFRLLPVGLPFLGATLTMQFYGQIDRILIGLLAPVQVVGWYAAATRIVGIPIFVPTLIATPLFPALTRCRGDRAVFRHTLNTSLRATLLATAPFCAAIAAAAPAIPGFLGWPAEFEAASVPMTILAPNLTLIAVDMVLGTALMAMGLERKWLLISVLAAVVNPSLNLLAIPFTQAMWGNGGIGAASVTVITEFVMLLGALVLMPRDLLDRAWLSDAARVCLAGASFVVVTRQLLGTGWPVPLDVAIGGLAFVGSAIVLRVIGPSDVRLVKQLAAGRVRARLARRAA